MADPITIVAIITSVLTAVGAFLGGLHYKIKMKCCCCQSDCMETEEVKQKKITKISSIKSI